MSLLDEFIARLHAYAAFRQWKPSRLSREAGLGPNSMARMYHEDWDPTLKTLRKLEAIIPEDFDHKAPPQADQSHVREKVA